MNTQEFLEAIWDLEDLHRELIHQIEKLLQRTQSFQETEPAVALGRMMQ